MPPLRRLKNGSKMRVRSSAGDPAAVVGDAHPQQLVPFRGQHHVAARPARLHGVQHQVDERVLQLRLVRAHVEARRQRPDVDLHAVRPRRRLDEPGYRAHRELEVDDVGGALAARHAAGSAG